MDYDDILAIAGTTLNYKGGHYRIEPSSMCRIETLLRQIELKALRAVEAKKPEKKLDDLIDTICYCVIAYKRICEDKK